MLTKEIERLFIESEVKYGARNQITVCIEEMAELQKELTKFLRVDADHDLSAIAEELADVEICCLMLRQFFENSEEVDGYKAKKLERIRKRLECW